MKTGEPEAHPSAIIKRRHSLPARVRNPDPLFSIRQPIKVRWFVGFRTLSLARLLSCGAPKAGNRSRRGRSENSALPRKSNRFSRCHPGRPITGAMRRGVSMLSSGFYSESCNDGCRLGCLPLWSGLPRHCQAGYTLLTPSYHDGQTSARGGI